MKPGPRPTTVRKTLTTKSTYIKPTPSKRFVPKVISQPGDTVGRGKK